MFTVARSRVGGLTSQQQTYVDALLSGKSETEAKDLAGYKAKPSSDTVRKALDGQPVGDYSEAAKDYAFRLAIERISGMPLDEGFETWQMRRGHELEPAARLAHEIQTGVTVRPCGFVLTDDERFGASADGFIGDDEGAEYKCLVSPERLRTILIDEDLSEFADQVQGGLWITGRKRWHFSLYCPALEPIGGELWTKVWERDEAYIEALEEDLWKFKELVDQNESALRNRRKAT